MQDLMTGAAALAQSPMVWMPVAVGLMVWTFMLGVRIGEMRSDDWWKRMLADSETVRPSQARMLAAVRKVTR